MTLSINFAINWDKSRLTESCNTNFLLKESSIFLFYLAYIDTSDFILMIWLWNWFILPSIVSLASFRSARDIYIYFLTASTIGSTEYTI